MGWPIFDKHVEGTEAFRPQMDNSKSKALGVVYTNWDKTCVDMADALVALGAVTKPEPADPAQEEAEAPAPAVEEQEEEAPAPAVEQQEEDAPAPAE